MNSLWSAIRSKLKTDPGAVFGMLYMSIFAIVAGIRFYYSGKIFFFLFVFRDLLLAYFFFTRLPSYKEGNRFEGFIAYLSTAISIFYIVPEGNVAAWVAVTSEVLSIFGFGIATFAAIELGPRIGIVAAKRGERCRTGVYRLFRHPMYTGYAFAELGWILLDIRNIPILILSYSCYLIRISAEEKVLSTQR